MDFIQKIKKLYNLNSQRNGHDEAEIKKAEYILNLKLPVILRQFYLEVGSLAELKIDGLFINEDNHLIICFNEYINCTFYILPEDLEKENPNVYLKRCDNTSCVWSYFLDEFIMHNVFKYALHNLEYNAEWEINEAWNCGDYNREKDFEMMVKKWKPIEYRGKKTQTLFDDFYTIDYSEIIRIAWSGDHDCVIYYGTTYENKYNVFKEKIEHEFNIEGK